VTVGSLVVIPLLANNGHLLATEPDSSVGGQWVAVASLKHARAAHAVAATSQGIYVIAGTGDEKGSPVLAVERFDGSAWNDETRLPGKGLNAPAAAIVDDLIYVIGGFETVTNIPTSDVLIFNTKTKEWSKGAPLPAPRGGHAAAVLKGKIHVIGGGNSRSTLADHSVFDPVTNHWSELAPLPHAEGSPAAVVFDGKLYAIGGRSGPKDFGDVMIYDENSNSWSPGPAIGPRATCGAVAFRDSIYLIGGESQAKSIVLADVLRLDRGSKSWGQISGMPTARSFARAVVFKDMIYVVGGSREPQRDHAPRGAAIVEKLRP
jgi:N-acetylneuraminic acid mutarotase